MLLHKLNTPFTSQLQLLAGYKEHQNKIKVSVQTLRDSLTKSK